MAENKKSWQSWALLAAIICLALNNETMSLVNDISIDMGLRRVYGLIASASLWGMPLIAMLMGNYFLGSTYSRNNRTLWRFMLPTAIISCGFWWIVSAAIQMQENYPGELDLQTFVQCLGEVLEAPGNIRFCHMVCSMFLLYPLLQSIARDYSVMRYSVIVLFLITLVEPLLRGIPYVQELRLFLDQLNWGFFRAWGFYILLGALLNKDEFSWQARLIVYCLGIISVGAVYYIAHSLSEGVVFVDLSVMDFDSPFAALQALAVALFFRQVFRQGSRSVQWLFLEGMWVYVPVICIAGAIGNRIPLFDGNAMLVLAARVLIMTTITVLIIFAFSRLKGFRRLVGCHYDTEEERG